MQKHSASGAPATGGRTLLRQAHQHYWLRRQEIVYRAILPYCRHGDVLAAGAGRGHGCELLRSQAEARVVPLDLDQPAARRLHAAYPQLLPVCSSFDALPFNDGTFDAVVGMHVVEHLWDHRTFVRESVRMLRPLGTLLVSTVNRLTARPPMIQPAAAWWNDGETPEETPAEDLVCTRQFASDELVDLLDSWFNITRVLGVNHGPRIAEWEAEHSPIVDALRSGPPEIWPAGLAELVDSLTADDFVIGPWDVQESLDILLVAARR